MNKQEKETSRRAVGQAIKNVGAAAVGSGIGYFGGAYATKKALKNDKVRKYLKQLPKKDRQAMLNKIRLTGGLAGAAAGGLSSVAMQKAINKDSEKTASFFTLYAARTLV